MDNTNQYAVIMAGGVGSRFWPLSTEAHPKQFIDVLGIGKTLMQLTYERLLTLVPQENIFILTNKIYVDLVLKQLPEIRVTNILTEPVRKNTAPCIAYAASKIHKMNPEACMIVCPSDHLILKGKEFKYSIQQALQEAQNKDMLMTLGIKPLRPDTGYGYIEFSKNNKIFAGKTTKVLQFREKPDKETAELFIRSGNFYWNSGIFVWKTSTILQAFKQYQTDLYDFFCADNTHYTTPQEQIFVDQAFEKCQDISIDYAILEKADNVHVVLATFDWSDLGTWKSLNEHLPKDTFNNSIIGNNVHTFNVKNCLVSVPNNKKVLIDGLSDYIIVEADNSLMILKSSNEQELKNYLRAMENHTSR